MINLYSAFPPWGAQSALQVSTTGHNTPKILLNLLGRIQVQLRGGAQAPTLLQDRSLPMCRVPHLLHAVEVRKMVVKCLNIIIYLPK